MLDLCSKLSPSSVQYSFTAAVEQLQVLVVESAEPYLMQMLAATYLQGPIVQPHLSCVELMSIARGPGGYLQLLAGAYLCIIQFPDAFSLLLTVHGQKMKNKPALQCIHVCYKRQACLG